MSDLPLVAAGRAIPDALDRVRRYCGLPWSGGGPETWAWQYYDALSTAHDDFVTPADVVCAASVHPGLSRDDMIFFRERYPAISTWLALLPSESRLWELTDTQRRHLTSLPDLHPPSLSFATKVLHRKRPFSVPLLDRHIIDWYRPITGERTAAAAWGPILETMYAEECDDQRRLLLSIGSATIESELWPDHELDERPQLSWLRMTDIAIWMGSRGPRIPALIGAV